MTELKRNVAFPPVSFAATCSLSEFEAEGFDVSDVQMLFDWQDGKLKLEPDEMIRMNRLALLVVRNG